MSFLPYTSLFAAIFAVVLIPLTVQVGLKRIATEIYFGEGGNMDLARRRAAQSNYVQYVPLLLVLMALCELAGAGQMLLLAIGGLMVVGRFLHAWCFLAGDGLGNGRAAGMLFTFAAYLTAAGYLLWRWSEGI